MRAEIKARAEEREAPHAPPYTVHPERGRVDAALGHRRGAAIVPARRMPDARITPKGRQTRCAGVPTERDLSAIGNTRVARMKARAR